MKEVTIQYLIDQLEAREENWKAEMLTLYDSGATDAEVMRELDLTVHQWRDLFEDRTFHIFRETVEIGRMMMKAWWFSQGRKHLGDNKFNTNLYKFMMANNFGWSDKSETSMTTIDFGNMSDADLNRMIKDLNTKLQHSRASSTV